MKKRFIYIIAILVVNSLQMHGMFVTTTRSMTRLTQLQQAGKAAIVRQAQQQRQLQEQQQRAYSSSSNERGSNEEGRVGGWLFNLLSGTGNSTERVEIKDEKSQRTEIPKMETLP